MTKKEKKVGVVLQDGDTILRWEIDVGHAAEIIQRVREHRGVEHAKRALDEFSHGVCVKLEEGIRQAVLRAMEDS